MEIHKEMLRFFRLDQPDAEQAVVPYIKRLYQGFLYPPELLLSHLFTDAYLLLRISALILHGGHAGLIRYDPGKEPRMDTHHFLNRSCQKLRIRIARQAEKHGIIVDSFPFLLFAFKENSELGLGQGTGTGQVLFIPCRLIFQRQTLQIVFHCLFRCSPAEDLIDVKPGKAACTHNLHGSDGIPSQSIEIILCSKALHSKRAGHGITQGTLHVICRRHVLPRFSCGLRQKTAADLSGGRTGQLIQADKARRDHIIGQDLSKLFPEFFRIKLHRIHVVEADKGIRAFSEACRHHLRET